MTNEGVITKGNIGLKNVKKRLALLYPESHELHIVSQPENYAVHLTIQLHDTKDHITITDEINSSEYALA